jgi:hypothetical protein
MQEMRDLQDQLSGEGGEDPLIGLKRMEIEQRGKMDEQRLQIEQQKLGLDQQKVQQANQINQERLRLQAVKLNQPTGIQNAA